MQIDPELLAEKNYSGSRLILIEDPKLLKLQEQLDALQKEVNPLIELLQEEYYPMIDPLYREVQELNERAKMLKEKIAEHTAKHRSTIQSIEEFETKAGLVKNKMQPVIMKTLEGQLGEFEIARHTVVKDGKIYAEVYDEIEEKVKAIRLSKAKKPK